jgi:penicillin amidase
MGVKHTHLFDSYKFAMEFGDRSNPMFKDGHQVAKRLQELVSFPQNFLVATTQGDIIYCSFSVIPERTVPEASFTKKGYMKEAVWKNLLISTDLPRAVNPKKGYLVSANNFIAPPQVKNGIILQRTFPTRAIRIAEMLEHLISTKDKRIGIEDLD